MEETRYLNRKQAGGMLASKLAPYARKPNVLVLALPRGGVPVAFEVAKALHAPLDVFLVRKLGVPGQEELAMGAIASGGIQVINEDVVRMLHIPLPIIEDVASKELRELERRERLYRDDRPLPTIQNRIVILIDDGLATGATMRAAAHALRLQHPARLVIAVPVAPPQSCDALRAEVDEMIVPLTPEFFRGVGWWYEDFSQVSDKEVHDVLALAEREHHSAA
jgi:predicted phosphoribosyltransferase